MVEEFDNGFVTEDERLLYFNVVHPNGLVDTFYMSEDEAREKYGDFEIDEGGTVTIYVDTGSEDV
jgi:hypothetical protein